MSGDPLPGPPSLRVEQVAAATRTLFLRYGYRRTSVDDIAREAGVAKATLYLHFAGKEEMFRTMIRRFRTEMKLRCDAAEMLEAPIERRVVELLHANYGTALEWFGDAAHLNELKMFANEHPIGSFGSSAPGFRQRLHHMLEGAADRGEVRMDGDVATADVVQTLIFAATGAKHAQTDGAQGLRAAFATLTHLILRGLLPA